MADDRKRYVFLSYGRKDVYPQDVTKPVERERYYPIVEKIYSALQLVRSTTHLTPWLDIRGLTAGEDFAEKIYRTIEQSDYLLLFIGRSSMNSEWCKKEWMHALEHCVTVIPILLEGSWREAELKAAYPERIRNATGINPQQSDGTWDEGYLVSEVMEAIQRPLPPTANLYNVKNLPEHHIKRPDYVNGLKKHLGVGEHHHTRQKSQQEIVALQGIGGIGKSTLALALCDDCEIQCAFEQIIWLEVGPNIKVDDVPSLMRIIGTHFGDSPDLYTDLQTSRALVQKHLSGKRTLIVLDDVWTENLADAFSWSGIICSVLITTRNKGLVEDAEAVNKLSPDEGLLLLATFVDPLNPDTAKLNDHHRAIVTTLDGYTLAIAIAGRWLNKYGHHRAEEYLKRLRSNETDLLKNLNMSKSDKNANLELSLSLSYNDLDEDDQKRFRALGLFAAGSSYPLTALDALWDTTDGFVEAGVLVDAGLLEMVKGTSGEDLYSQHSLLRAYARALTQPEEAADFFNHYADFYTNVANQFHKLPPEEWGILEDNLSNIHAVGDELARKTDIGQNGDLERVVAFSYNTTQYLAKRREIRRVEWSEMGVNAAHRLQLLATDKESYRLKEGVLLNQLGTIRYHLGQKQIALKIFEQAFEIARKEEDWTGKMTLLNNMLSVLNDLGEDENLIEAYENILTMVQKGGDTKLMATVLNNLGKMWSKKGDFLKALDNYEQAANVINNTNEKNLEATIFNNIGRMQQEIGNREKALISYERALHIRQLVGDRNGEAITRNNIAQIYFANGEFEKALSSFKDLLPIFVENGNLEGEVALRANISFTHDKLGQKNERVAQLKAAITILKQNNLAFSAGGMSAQEYEFILQKWESEDDLLSSLVKLKQFVQENGEDKLKDLLKQLGKDDDVIELLLTHIQETNKPE